MSEGFPNAVIDWWQEDEQPVFGPQYPPNFQQSYSDSTLKSTYTEQKEIVAETYGVEPGKFIGYLEESSNLWNDVKNASIETDVDPNLLYSIGMQEGFAGNQYWKQGGLSSEMLVYQADDPNAPEGTFFEGGPSYAGLEPTMGSTQKFLWDLFGKPDKGGYNLAEEGSGETGYYKKNGIWHYQEPSVDMSFYNRYDETEWVDSYADVGLDIYFNIEDNLLEAGYLSNPIKTRQADNNRPSTTNEAGLYVEHGEVKRSDAWVMTGALINQNQDWMKNIFNNLKLDWDSISQEEQTFWTYASFNGGPGLAKNLLEKYGSMDNIIAFRKHYENNKADYIGEDSKETKSVEKHIRYIDNILRVTGAENLLEVYNPFQFEYYE